METKNTVQLDPNSIYVPKRASTIKRIGAFFVDLIFALFLATGIAALTSVIIGFDNYNTTINERYVVDGLLVEDENGTIEVNGTNYVYINTLTTYTDEQKEAVYTTCSNDTILKKAYLQRNYGTIIIITSAAFFSLLIYDFVIPLFIKHGRTVGTCLFGIGYVTDEDIDVKPKNIFVRFLFGRLIIDVLIPFSGLMYIMLQTGYGIVGIILIAGVLLGNIGTLCFTKDKRGLHDIVARIKPIDNTCQIYFKTVEELNAKRAEEALARKETKKE